MAGSDRRQRILDKAAPLFAAKGIDGCTVRDIADAAGLLSGSLYHHFDSKDAMVEEIVASYLRALHDRYADVMAAELDAGVRLRKLIHCSLEVAQAHPHASEIYQGSRGYFASDERFAVLRELATGVFDTWQRAIALGVGEREFRKDVNARVFHRFLRDAVFLSSRWFHPSEAYGIDELADDTAAIFLNGFVAR